ncbi:15089_t:CDS:2 [Funneliformis geosporum]|uniref:15089_t:CDS:1 n=1 Tax=Funneliformis geosporum TaxID=1117311 RepID=A0A9W4SCC7_9GLOM|nr:15089_t:CDS:2 [Funneliformis geosporum]
MISKEESTPSNSSYGIIGPNFARLLLSTSPVKPEFISMNTAVTTVARMSSNRAQSNNATINVVSKPAKRFDWDMVLLLIDYANSSTLGDQRFADEFIKRRKADASGFAVNRGTTRSLRLAFKWYREAVEQGYIASQIKVDLLFEKGEGTKKKKSRKDLLLISTSIRKQKFTVRPPYNHLIGSRDFIEE